ncbi:MAG: hypothetical protein REJ50_24800 [Bordetella sp.]|nr:hypothetical protein [Bordetella sp.]
MRFFFRDSHAYPGCPVRVQSAGAHTGAATPIVAEFADGTGALGSGMLMPDGELWLDLDAYDTAKGHRVAPHRWALVRVAVMGDSADGEWKVARRLTPQT